MCSNIIQLVSNSKSDTALINKTRFSQSEILNNDVKLELAKLKQEKKLKAEINKEIFEKNKKHAELKNQEAELLKKHKDLLESIIQKRTAENNALKEKISKMEKLNTELERQKLILNEANNKTKIISDKLKGNNISDRIMNKKEIQRSESEIFSSIDKLMVKLNKKKDNKVSKDSKDIKDSKDNTTKLMMDRIKALKEKMDKVKAIEKTKKNLITSVKKQVKGLEAGNLANNVKDDKKDKKVVHIKDKTDKKSNNGNNDNKGSIGSKFTNNNKASIMIRNVKKDNKINKVKQIKLITNFEKQIIQSKEKNIKNPTTNGTVAKLEKPIHELDKEMTNLKKNSISNNSIKIHKLNKPSKPINQTLTIKSTIKSNPTTKPTTKLTKTKPAIKLNKLSKKKPLSDIRKFPSVLPPPKSSQSKQIIQTKQIKKTKQSKQDFLPIPTKKILTSILTDPKNKTKDDINDKIMALNYKLSTKKNAEKLRFKQSTSIDQDKITKNKIAHLYDIKMSNDENLVFNSLVKTNKEVDHFYNTNHKTLEKVVDLFEHNKDNEVNNLQKVYLFS